MKILWTTYASITFSRKTVLTTLLVYLICVVSGPFGTFDELSLLDLSLFWAPVVVLALGVSGLSCMLTITWFPRLVDLRHAIITGTVFFCLYTPLLFGLAASGVLGQVPQSMSIVHVLATVIALACVLGIWGLVFGPPPSLLVSTPAPRPRLYARLPAAGDRLITRITVQDHYVDVRLSDGSSNRLLMRFSDAVNEMDAVDGFCTHRSHWVARDAVASAIKDGAKEFAILKSGGRIPVSKTYRENLVVAGFL